MLYASIIVKVLYWYQAVADSKSSNPSASAHADPTANVVPLAGLLAESALSETQAEQPPGSCDASFVALEPFRIGTFMPDKETYATTAAVEQSEKSWLSDRSTSKDWGHGR